MEEDQPERQVIVKNIFCVKERTELSLLAEFVEEHGSNLFSDELRNLFKCNILRVIYDSQQEALKRMNERMSQKCHYNDIRQMRHHNVEEKNQNRISQPEVPHMYQNCHYIMSENIINEPIPGPSISNENVLSDIQRNIELIYKKAIARSSGIPVEPYKPKKLKSVNSSTTKKHNLPLKKRDFTTPTPGPSNAIASPNQPNRISWVENTSQSENDEMEIPTSTLHYGNPNNDYGCARARFYNPNIDSHNIKKEYIDTNRHIPVEESYMRQSNQQPVDMQLPYARPASPRRFTHPPVRLRNDPHEIYMNRILNNFSHNQQEPVQMTLHPDISQMRLLIEKLNEDDSSENSL